MGKGRGSNDKAMAIAARLQRASETKKNDRTIRIKIIPNKFI
jgi:hypothetical protein